MNYFCTPKVKGAVSPILGSIALESGDPTVAYHAINKHVEID